MTEHGSNVAVTIQPKVPVAGMVLLIGIFTTLLVGCVFLLLQSNKRTELAMSTAERQARSYIANLTRDPAAVQFRDVHADDRCVTGEINAKNGYGAYVGYQKFFYSPSEDFGSIEESALMPALPGSNEALQALSSDMEFVRNLSSCNVGRPTRR